MLRCRDAADIRAFVDDTGVCLLFPVQGLEVPNVYHAVAGFAKETSPNHDDPTISLTWRTKDQALGQGWWYYGKLLRGKATLVSLSLLPAFYALSDNFGDENDYLAEYQAGTLSAEAKAIYEALRTHGPLHAVELKRKAGLYGDENKTRFDRALTDLQGGLKVLPTGIADAGAWHYAFIYDLVARWAPTLSEQARLYSRPAAREAILRAHLRNVIWASPRELERLLGWRRREIETGLEALVAAGVLLRTDDGVEIQEK